MPLSTWLSNLGHRSAKPRKRFAPRACLPRRRGWRPSVNTFEDRVVPSLMVTSALDDGSAGTLRWAIANASAGDTIRFASSLAQQTIMLSGTELSITQDLTISGPGANALAISGDGASRVFDIGAGANVTISGLNIENGQATDGAGIRNAGNLTLTNDLVTGNIAQGVPGSGPLADGSGRGGGIEDVAGATLNVVKSQINNNQALGAPGRAGIGGGIDNEGGTVSLVWSSLANNLAQGGTGDPGAAGIDGVPTSSVPEAPGGPGGAGGLGGQGLGGGLANFGGSIGLVHSTLSGNIAQGGVGGTGGAGGQGGNPGQSTPGGGAGGAGGAGGPGAGGALYNNSDTAPVSASLTQSTLQGNQAIGGAGGQGGQGGAGVNPPGLNWNGTGGGAGGAAGAGAQGLGGGIANTGGNPLSLVLTQSALIGNLAQGGAGGLGGAGGIGSNGAPTSSGACGSSGGTGGAGGAGGAAGDGSGGGMQSRNASLVLTHTDFSGNQAIGGLGGSGGAGAQGGNGNPGTYGQTDYPGNGGAGGAAGTGGNGLGGGLTMVSGLLTAVQDDFFANLAQGGAGGGGGAGGNAGTSTSGKVGNAGHGGAGGNGGNGLGGGMYVEDGTADFEGGSFVNNQALAAAGGSGGASGTGRNPAAGSDGTAGEGMGGAAYLAGGDVAISMDTLFAGNFATTSYPDVFGAYTTP